MVRFYDVITLLAIVTGLLHRKVPGGEILVHLQCSMDIRT
jgi:hypothetical protein